MTALDIIAPPSTPGPAPAATATRGLMSGAASAFAALLTPQGATAGGATAGGATAGGATPPGQAEAGAATLSFTVEGQPAADAPVLAEVPSPDGQAQMLSGAALFAQAPSPVAMPVGQAAPLSEARSGASAPAVASPAAEPAPPTTGAGDPTSAADATVPAKTATPGAASAAAAAVQAVSSQGAAGASAALAFETAVAEVRKQAQGVEGDRRTDRQDRQKAPAATPASTSIAATPAAGPATSTAAAPASTAGAAPSSAASAAPASAPEGQPAPPTMDPAPQVEGEAPTAETPTPASPTPAARETGVLGLARATIETTATLAAQIIRRLEQRSTRFEMALTPEGLGRVDVAMEIDGDGQLAARLAFDNPVASLELRARADELRRQLEAAGFTLAEDALDFTQRDGGASGQAFDRGGERRFGRAFAGAAALSDQADALIGERIQLSLTPSGVDMKV